MSTRDDMVLEVQVWINETYGDIFEASGYDRLEENGQTSWDVTNGLIMGLQIELGISSIAPSFGPTTEAYLDDYGTISEGNNDENSNINQIIQGGCYATGYNPYGFNGIFDENLTLAIKELEGNIGISQTGIVDTKLMKALLTMNAYVLLTDGSEKVREFQQWLNNEYSSKSVFDYIPCDGLYSRTTQEGLVYGIQFECDLDDVANGSFGPTTKANLKEKGQVFLGDNDASSGKMFVHLFKGGYLCNNVTSSVTFNGVFDSELENAIIEFQEFAALEINGDGDYETWCEFIVSTGDETRDTKGFDCSANKLSSARVETLKSQGYEIGGRYLANIKGGLDKCLESYELSHMFNEGLSIFPIMQLAGASSDYFNYENGEYDAKVALQNAVYIYSIPYGTTIYFAVDYDAYEYEAETTIKSYFEGVNDYISANGDLYNIGIYASRNTCTIISGYGLAKHSFVSGMSTGYSGNLGYPLPENWSFNQISEDYDFEIDHDVYRGTDTGFSDFEIPNANLRIVNYMKLLHEKAVEYSPGQSMEYYNNAVLDYFREAHYSGLEWLEVAGKVNTGFLDYLEDENIPLYGTYATLNNVDPSTNIELDLSHCCASTQGYYKNGIESNDFSNLGDFGAWCGDYVSLFAEYYNNDNNLNYTCEEYVEKYCATEENSLYGISDYISDIDAYLIAYSLLQNIESPLYEVFEDYYNSGYLNRYSKFFDERQSGSEEIMYNLAYNALLPDNTVATDLYITGLFDTSTGLILNLINDQDKVDFSRAYVNKQLSFIQGRKH